MEGDWDSGWRLFCVGRAHRLQEPGLASEATVQMSTPPTADFPAVFALCTVDLGLPFPSCVLDPLVSFVLALPG